MKELRENFLKAGGKFVNYSVSKLFFIENTLSFNKDVLTVGDGYDYVTRTSQNQGILQTTGFVNQENLNPSGTWSLGLLQMDFFYRNKPWYAGQFVRKVTPLLPMDRYSVLYFTVLLNKLKPKLLAGLVREVDKMFLSSKLQVPVKNGEIDFQYIENYIKTLEAERIETLEAYLTVTGLKDYHLTEKDEKTLDTFAKLSDTESRVEYLGTYALSQLFTITGTRSLDEGKLTFISDGINFVGRVFENNGIKGFIDRQTFEPNEADTVTATVIGNYKYVKYQREPYYTSQNINKLVPKEKLSKGAIYYLITYIQKFVSQYDGQQGGYKLDEISNFELSLPTIGDCPDYTFMSDLICTVEKLVIKDLVEWTDKKIEATKEVVSR